MSANAVAPLITKIAVTLSKYIEGPPPPPVAGEILNTDLQVEKRFELPVNETQQFDVKGPGRYLVRVQLPSGEVMHGEASVVAGEQTPEVRLNASESPHEWLSWQHYLGNLGNRPEDATPIAAEVRNSLWLRVWKFAGGSWQIQEPNLFISNQDQACIVVQTYVEPTALHSLQLGGKAVPHRTIGLPPCPGPVQILIRATRHNTELNGGIVVRIASFDQNVETLLKYASNGSSAEAQTLSTGLGQITFSHLTEQDKEDLDKAESAVKAKLVNPNGAAVGFYYLLQCGAYDRMHDWPNNFANWFPWLPDASIIHAMQMLSDPNRKDLDHATARILQAADAGLPVYSSGLRYLYWNLCACATDEKRRIPARVKTAYSRIREIATAADWSQVRTTVYGADPVSPDCDRVTGIPEHKNGLWFVQRP
jgi:hypothetical protein